MRPEPINGHHPEITKMVYEVRYDQGYTYLDRCGHILNALLADGSDWVLASGRGVSPQGAPLIHRVTRAQLHFSAEKIDLTMLAKPAGSLDSDDSNLLADYAGDVCATIFDELGIASVKRLGFRVWTFFPFDDECAASSWLYGLSLYSSGGHLESGFGAEFSTMASVFRLTGEDRNFRVECTPVERATRVITDKGKATVNTDGGSASGVEHGAQIDVDVYQEKPSVLAHSEYIRTSYNMTFEGLAKAADTSKRKRDQ